MPLFSVVIPVYNRAHLLARALDSVAAQTFRDFEVIVVDDGSSDNIAHVVASRPGPLRLLSIENRGPGGARNAGIEAATGEYVAFLDSDDQWLPLTLALYAQAIAASTTAPSFLCGAFAATPSATAAGTPAPPAQSPAPRIELYPDFFSSSINPIAGFAPSTVAIARDELLRVGGFAPRLRNWEDVDLFLRLGRAKGFARIHSPACALRNIQSDSLSRSSTGDLRGADHLIRNERNRAYPPGSRAKVAEYLRAISVTLVRQGQVREAWAIYRNTLLWQIEMRRFKYLLGFPVLALGRTP